MNRRTLTSIYALLVLLATLLAACGGTRLSEVARRGEAFSAELVSLKADLERPIGRVFARTCDEDVGDARCGVNLDDPLVRAEGFVAEVRGSKKRWAVAIVLVNSAGLVPATYLAVGRRKRSS